MPLGQSFTPGQSVSYTSNRTNAPSAIQSGADALKLISLHLPQTLQGNPIAPPSLLQPRIGGAGASGLALRGAPLSRPSGAGQPGAPPPGMMGNSTTYWDPNEQLPFWLRGGQQGGGNLQNMIQQIFGGGNPFGGGATYDPGVPFDPTSAQTPSDPTFGFGQPGSGAYEAPAPSGGSGGGGYYGGGGYGGGGGRDIPQI